MPISKINPDGTVKVYNSVTGEVRDVKPEQLAQLNPKMVGQYQEMINATSNVKSGVATVKDLPEAQRTAVGATLQGQGFEPEKAAKEKDAQKIKDELSASSKALLDVIKAGEKGKLKGQAYRDQLDAAASRLAAAKGFSEGGKALTGPELTTLGGQIPAIEQVGPNVLDKIIGRIPPQRGHVVDNEATLKRKAETALAIAQGKEIDPSKVYQGGQDEGPTLGGLAANAGGNINGILNGILGAPAQAFQAGQQAVKSGNPQEINDATNPTMMIMNMLKGYGQSLNETAGRPMEGGNIVGRAATNAYKNPVNALLTALPIAQGVSGLRGAQMAGKAAQVADVSETAGGANVAQNATRGLADLLRGGGSKEYVARGSGQGNFIPQNQVLMEEGVLSRPTQVGQVQASKLGMNKWGGELEKLYTKTDKKFTGSEVGQTLDTGLKDLGYDQKAIKFIKNYVNEKGDFDITKADSVIPPKNLWKAAQSLEKGPPKMLKNPESAMAYKQLAQDVARIVRKDLLTKVKGTRIASAKYSALKDFYDNLPESTSGVGVSNRGIIGGTAEAIKGVANPLMNLLYKGATKLSK